MTNKNDKNFITECKIFIFNSKMTPFWHNKAQKDIHKTYTLSDNQMNNE